METIKTSDLIPDRLNFIGLSISNLQNRGEIKNYIEYAIRANQSKILYGHSLWTITIIKKAPIIKCEL